MSFNDIEKLLRERLSAGSSRPLPSPGFEDRVRSSLTTRVSSHRRAHMIEALVGIAAVIALAAVVVPWWSEPRQPNLGAANDTSPSAVPTTLVSPSPTAAPLAHAKKWFLAFDYPAAWTLDDQNVLSQDSSAMKSNSILFLPNNDLEIYGRSVGFVGSGSAKDICQRDPDNRQIGCTTQWTLPENSVEIRFWVSSDGLWNSENAIHGAPLDGYTPTTVDGLPAMFAKTAGSISNAAFLKASPPSPVAPSASGVRPVETVPGADEVLSWALPTQRMLGTYAIDAAIRGPKTAELETQVRAMIASLHWEPAAYRLPTDPAMLETPKAAAIAAGLSSIRAEPIWTTFKHDHGRYLDCFPSTAGVKVSATVTSSEQALLTQPLEVTCSTAIEPNAMQGWTLSLTQTWAAGSDYPAGYCTNNYNLRLDGTGPIFEQTDRWVKCMQYPHVRNYGLN